jgi:hypothetical protein
MEARRAPSRGGRVKRALASGAAILALAAVVSSCGDDNGYSSAEDLPESVVAAVGDREITSAELRERAKLLAPGQVRPGDDPPPRAELEQQAIALLVEETALEREAAERGIEVSAREVRRRWEAVSANQFANRKELERFLGGQSVEALLVQLRAQTLRERIVQDVRAKADGDPTQATKQWEDAFRERTREDTTCRARYAGAGCPEGGS